MTPTATGKAIWSTGTGHALLGSGHTLTSGDRLISKIESWDSTKTVTMQTNGDLAYRLNGVLKWHSRTYVAGSHARITTRGQLQVVAPSGRIRWSTSHTGQGGWFDVDSGMLFNGYTGAVLWQMPGFL
ncbi:hypothetical protein [Flexivirga alba]|uniref:Bulb-type lectin domain-containing protein n=1 Tax=Flexivirga alba TaxID=702742 RepID=A0ABW2AH38_9MICO